MTPAALQTIANHFFQVAYVVEDMPDAEASFSRIFEVPSFFRMEDVAFGADCLYRGNPSDSAAHLSIGYLGDTQIELIQPVRGESLYREFLESHGPGLHHIAFDVPDFPATVRALEADGLEILAEGSVGPGSHFAYFDCATAGASVIEILGFSDDVRGFMAQIKDQQGKQKT